MRSLLELMDVHRDLREKLAVHRDLVVGLEFRRAVDALAVFEADLRRHMEAEEKHVLPLYEARVGHVRGGDPRLFHLEHETLLRNLEAVKTLLGEILRDPNAGPRRAHELLHREAPLLDLIEHHDLREERILYPRLDQAISVEEREAILAGCGL